MRSSSPAIIKVNKKWCRYLFYYKWSFCIQSEFIFLLLCYDIEFLLKKSIFFWYPCNYFLRPSKSVKIKRFLYSYFLSLKFSNEEKKTVHTKWCYGSLEFRECVSFTLHLMAKRSKYVTLDWKGTAYSH